jgi:hypothetical protein
MNQNLELSPLQQPQRGALRSPDDVREALAWQQIGVLAHDGHPACARCEFLRVDPPGPHDPGCTECTLGDKGWHRVEWCGAYAVWLEQRDEVAA